MTTACPEVRSVRKKIKIILSIYIYVIGWAGVGWQLHCKTCRSLHELNRQGTLFFFFFGGQSQLAVELDHLCGVANVYSAQGE